MPNRKALELSSRSMFAKPGHEIRLHNGQGAGSRCGGPLQCRICATQRAVIEHVLEHGVTTGMTVTVALNGVTTTATWQDCQDVLVACVYAGSVVRMN